MKKFPNLFGTPCVLFRAVALFAIIGLAMAVLSLTGCDNSTSSSSSGGSGGGSGGGGDPIKLEVENEYTKTIRYINAGYMDFGNTVYYPYWADADIAQGQTKTLTFILPSDWLGASSSVFFYDAPMTEVPMNDVKVNPHLSSHYIAEVSAVFIVPGKTTKLKLNSSGTIEIVYNPPLPNSQQ